MQMTQSWPVAALCIFFPFLAGCVTEAVKFPEKVRDQWNETSMVDQTLLANSGSMEVVISQPESLGYQRLQVYLNASAKVRSVIASEGNPDVLRETNRPMRLPRLDLFYIRHGRMYQFNGIRQLTSHYPDPPSVCPIPAEDGHAIQRMQSISELHKTMH
jgi:hypothetical protein